jgi:hypothetical protein
VESKLGPLGTSATYWPIVPAPGDCENGHITINVIMNALYTSCFVRAWCLKITLRYTYPYPASIYYTKFYLGRCLALDAQKRNIEDWTGQVAV